MKTSKLVLLLLTALLLGICIGFLANGAVIRARIRHFSEIREHRSEHILNMLTQHLQLTEEQQGQIRGVVATYETRITEARQKSEALYNSPMEEMSKAIFAYLTPEQREAYEKMRTKQHSRHRKSRTLMSAFPPDTSDAAR